MTTCVRHPQREATHQCLKYGNYLCDECLRCRDPKLYCKHRPACAIWFIDKQRRRQEHEEQSAAALPAATQPQARSIIPI